MDAGSGSAATAYFYPRPPRGGRLFRIRLVTGYFVISIHALREEGDASNCGWFALHAIFLSTPSARRATFAQRIPVLEEQIISIHALREEGDRNTRPSCGR